MDTESNFELNLNELQRANYAVLRKNGGFSLTNDGEMIALILRKSDGNWTVTKINKSECRGVFLTDTEYSKTEIIRQSGGMHGVGENIGVGIKNKLNQREAIKNSGITFRIKSINTPEIFIQLSDAKTRKEALEATTQFFEDGAISGRRFDVPDSILNTAPMFKTPNKAAVLWGGLSSLEQAISTLAILSGLLFSIAAPSFLFGSLERAERLNLSLVDAIFRSGQSGHTEGLVVLIVLLWFTVSVPIWIWPKLKKTK